MGILVCLKMGYTTQNSKLLRWGILGMIMICTNKMICWRNCYAWAAYGWILVPFHPFALATYRSLGPGLWTRVLAG
jgi:hypothetical protein